MAFPLTGLLVGGGLGLIKSLAFDQPAVERQRKVEATKALTQPFTGVAAGPIRENNPFGDALSAGVTGMSMEQQARALDMQNRLLSRMSPFGGGTQAAVIGQVLANQAAAQPIGNLGTHQVGGVPGLQSGQPFIA